VRRVGNGIVVVATQAARHFKIEKISNQIRRQYSQSRIG